MVALGLALLAPRSSRGQIVYDEFNYLPIVSKPQTAGFGGYSLRFYGFGDQDVDRVKIPIDPQVPADVGATDFTLEFWMKASPGDNDAGTCFTGSDNWITGNIMFDRDVFGGGDYGDYGVSLFNSGLAFGVAVGNSGEGICGTTNLEDGAWRHVAVQRRRSDGQMSLYVDGQLQAQADGPNGDASYRDGRSGFANDPFLVIGAEKHDAGSSFPSFSGWIDEVRLSKVLRYTSNFTRPSAPFVTDANTVALYHFDEGPAGACTTGKTIVDSSGASGGPSNGFCRYGGSPNPGPVYSTDTP
jgi:hypothetical protein